MSDALYVILIITIPFGLWGVVSMIVYFINKGW
jgi:hypothetical protein